MTSRIIPFAAALVILASAAAAQTITIRPNSPTSDAAGVPGQTQRVETSISFVLTGPAMSDITEMKVRSEAVRRAIYETAAQECRILSDVFQADCRLVNVRANSSVQARGAGAEGVNGNGSATYELTTRR